MSVLRAEAVTAGYDGPPILDQVSVEIPAGESTVILGPNGAGKSTLAKAIIGLLPITSGKILLQERDVTGMGPHKLIRQGLAYLPQLANIFDQLSVLENLEMGGYTVGSKLRARIETVLELFPDLANDRTKKGGALSGGQQRMLAVARMLMTDPQVAILDEPTAGLSPLYADRVWEQIDRIRGLGVGLMVVEQNATMAMDHADNVYLLAQGRTVTSGKAADLREQPDVARVLVG